MKYEEIVKHMLTKLDEEISDADTYLNMAEAAMKMANTDMNERLVAGILDIAHDEYTHAEFICAMIEEYDGKVPEAQMAKFDALTKRIEPFFQ